MLFVFTGISRPVTSSLQIPLPARADRLLSKQNQVAPCELTRCGSSPSEYTLHRIFHSRILQYFPPNFRPGPAPTTRHVHLLLSEHMPDCQEEFRSVLLIDYYRYCLDSVLAVLIGMLSFFTMFIEFIRPNNVI